MKLLFITPFISSSGGVERILSVRTNYLIEKWKYDISILATNSPVTNTHYQFNKKTDLYSEKASGKGFMYLFNYFKILKKYSKTINPDLIIVCDNGLKGYLIPLLISTKKNKVIFECHVTRFDNELKIFHPGRLINFFKFKLYDFLLAKYLKIVILSQSFKSEIKSKNTVIIPNSLWFSSADISNNKAQKVIAVGRHSYEKGYPDMLAIWKKVLKTHPNWMLEIYGETDLNLDLHAMILKLGIQNNVTLFDPVKNIKDKYLQASVLILSSKYEGFGMVLIEAMACGLPCVSFDCKYGPREIITNSEDGFLIPPENKDLFVEKLNLLLSNEDLRLKMGQKAKIKSEKFNIDTIMLEWHKLYRSL